MPYSATAEVYFIAAMMILILIVCAAAVYFFVKTYKKEMRAKEAKKLKQQEPKEYAEK
jgi:flagellar basal body-associated protein FliL